MAEKVRVELRKFSEIREPAFADYISEWMKTGEKIVPYSVEPKGRGFGELRKQWALDETEEVRRTGFVPATLYFLTDRKDRIFGAIHFRHELNERLNLYGGHIGFGVRPSERRKGYATIMLQKLLQDVRKLGYARVLLTCDDDNRGSIGAIRNCHGELENKVDHEGVLTRRYWIQLE